MASDNGNGSNGNGHNGNGNGDHAAIVPEVMPSPGRPTLWRDEFLVKIEKFATLGMTKKDIARSLMVTTETLMDWQRNKPEIREAYDRGRTKGGEYFLSKIIKAAEDPKFWGAAAWWLEKAFPDSFSPKQTMQIEHTNAITDADIAEAEKRLKIM